MVFDPLTPRNLRRGIIFILKLFSVVIPTLIFTIFFINYLPDFYYRLGNFLAIFFYIFALSVIMSPYDGFKIGTTGLRELQFSHIISLFITNILTFIVFSLVGKAILPILPFLIMMGFQIIACFIYTSFNDNIYHRLYPSRESVIIYSGHNSWDAQVAQKFVSSRQHYTVKAICSEDEGFEAIRSQIDKYHTCIIGALSTDLRARIIDYCYQVRKQIFIIPSIEDIIINNSQTVQIGDSLVYRVKNQKLSLEQLMLKRAFDIVFSAIFLIITSPIILISALAIKLYDRGPVFFKQRRLTRNAEPFDILKFRTMIVDAEKDGAQYTIENDTRITPVGNFLRRTRIDEIPQFINVLKGEMSVVGPRAERIENYEAYCAQMPEFIYRTKVKAGITGYSQVYGKYNTSFEDKARMDIHYIEKFSLLNDIKLILATAKVVFIGEATEGFESSFIEEVIRENSESDNEN